MVIAAIAGYVLGSIPTALLVGKQLGFDPREHGDRNPGWWNMRRLAGDRAALTVFLVDIVKGIAAAVVGSLLWGPWWWAYVAVFFAMVGHAFPLFGGLRGGRGVLTFMGGMAVLAPLAVGICVAVGLVVAVAVRNFAYGARVMVFGVPIVQLLIAPRAHVATTAALMTFIGLRFLAARISAPSTSSRGVASPA